jgi:hypothetical protein
MPQQNEKTSLSRDAAVGRSMKITGIAFVTVGIAWMVIGRLARVDAPFLILNFHIPVILLGLFLTYRGKQYASRSRPAELLSDKRPPVLYLRPFKKDASTVARVLPGIANPALLLQTFYTFEEQLTEAIEPIGPLVALAQPQASLPRPGAARYHAPDDEWKDQVEELLRKARLVIFRPGESEALMWEIEKAFEILKPSQLLFLIHRTSKKEYEAFTRSLKKSHGFSLPAPSNVNGFIAFSEGWSSRFLSFKMPYFRRSNYKPWKRQVNHALESVFHDLGVRSRPSPISALTIAAISILALFLVFILAIVLSCTY